MRVLHVNAGTETGGGRVHLISLLSQFQNKNVELLTFQQGLISKEASQLGIKTTVLNQKHQLDLSILKPLKEHINSGKFDIIHTHGPRANLFVNLIRQKITSKWVVTVHSDPTLDFINNGIKGKLFSFFNLKSINKADKVITVSSEIKNNLISYGYNKNNIEVIHNGINFTETPSFNKEKQTLFTITHIGRFHPIKRHKYLLESVKNAKISNYRINLIGDGELIEEIKAKVEEFGMNNNVKFHGYLTREEINYVLDQSDITLLTSESETFPLVLLESANRRVPFISTNVGDVNDMDPNREYSWIVPVNDQEALKAAIKNASIDWENGELHAKGEKAYKSLSKKFTIERMYAETWKFYENVYNN